MKSRKAVAWDVFAVEMAALEVKVTAEDADRSPSKSWSAVVRTALRSLYRLMGECRTYAAKEACRVRYTRILARYPNVWAS